MASNTNQIQSCLIIKMSNIIKEEEELQEYSRPSKRRSYFKSLKLLKEAHFELFENPEIVLSCRERRIAYTAHSPSSILSIQSRCPYNR